MTLRWRPALYECVEAEVWLNSKLWYTIICVLRPRCGLRVTARYIMALGVVLLSCSWY